MIIVEGPDGAGKSTIAAALSLASGWELRHESRQWDGWKYYMQAAWLGGLVVYDRFHLGEAVYPIIKQDGRKPLLIWQQQMVERVLLSHGAVLVLCTPRPDFMARVYATRGETFVSAADIPEMVRLFHSAGRRSLLPMVTYDLEARPLVEVVDDVATLSRLVRSTAALLPYGGVGSTERGGVLVVGHSMPRGYEAADRHYPALSRYNGASAYLAQALQLSGHTHHYLTNAFKHPPKHGMVYNLEAIREEVRLLEPRLVVALGNEAEAFLLEAGIPCTMVPHPSWQMRFNHKNIQSYARSFA